MRPGGGLAHKVAVSVIGIADGVAIGLSDRGEIPALIVLVLVHALVGGDGGEKAKLVIGISLFFLPGVIYGKRLKYAFISQHFFNPLFQLALYPFLSKGM